MAHRLALIGFGTVGQGLAEILRDKADDLKVQYGFEAQIVAISDSQKGSIYHPDGLDLTAALRSSLETYPDSQGLGRGWDSLTTIRNSNADTVVEVAWTDLETGQPAISHVRAAFEAGRHVVTSNKGPAALAYRDLHQLGDSRRDRAHRTAEWSMRSVRPSTGWARLS